MSERGMTLSRGAKVLLLAAACLTLAFLYAIALVIAVDAFMDMGRTATNVIGNSIACAVIAKWEGLLADPARDTPVVESVLGSRESGAAAASNR